MRYTVLTRGLNYYVKGEEMKQLDRLVWWDPADNTYRGESLTKKQCKAFTAVLQKEKKPNDTKRIHRECSQD
jgi:hypothetical protein